jgi:hypothetical protein
MGGFAVRRALAAVLVGVGVFLLVISALLRFYAPDRAEKTPLDLDITLVATGPATFGVGGSQTESGSLQATRHVRVDSASSDSDVVVVVETLCIVKIVDNPPECVSAQDPQNRLVSFTTDRVAADRKSAESVNDAKYGEYVNSDTSVNHVGLSYKWPFHAKKQTYQFFDPQSGQAAPANFLRTEKLAGINCYVYEAKEAGLDVDVAPGVPGKYSDDRTVWIDPVTGTIVKGVEHQVRTLANGDPALDATFTFDDKSIKLQAKKALDGRDQITLLTGWLPLIGLVLGVAALGGGFLLSRTQRPTDPADVQGAPADGPHHEATERRSVDH